MEDGKYVDGSLWFYAPNKGAPVVFAFLFAVSMGWHIQQCIHYKCWKVTGIFPWSALLFVIGYVAREVGAFNFDDIEVFIVSLVFIYAAPPLYELANYFILSRILYYVPYQSPIHPGRVITTFGAISTIIEALNANGAALVANTSLSESKQNTGKALLKSALVIQLGVLGLFVILAAHFHRKCRKANILPENLKAVLVTLYISSALIGARTIFRTVEYFTTASLNFYKIDDPNTISPVFRYEWFFWVFEAVLMVINTFLLNVRHPMRFLPRNNKTYLAEDGVTEIEGPGYLDERKWYITILDPFDLGGLLKGQNMNERFWTTHEEGRNGTTGGTGDVEKGPAQKGVAVQEK